MRWKTNAYKVYKGGNILCIIYIYKGMVGWIGKQNVQKTTV